MFDEKNINRGLMSFDCGECSDACREKGEVFKFVVKFFQCQNGPSEKKIENSIKVAQHVMKSEYLEWLKGKKDGQKDTEHPDNTDNVSV